MDLKKVGDELAKAALGAVDPEAAMLRALRLEGQRLRLGTVTVPLAEVERVVVVGGGKAAVAMARAAERVLGEWITGGVVVCSHRRGKLPKQIEVAPGSHPLPNEQGQRSTERMLALLHGLGPRDLVLCLVSGGGSALMTAPAEGVSLSDLEQLNATLLGAGAPIEAINAVRKHLSRLKGGRLAALASPARVVSCILSDVVGNPLDVIASGPTAPDPTTYGDALEVLRRYRVLDEVPATVRDQLTGGAAKELADTPGPDDPLFERVSNVIIGSNAEAAEAALDRAKALGFEALLLSTSVQGEASQVARVYAAMLRELVLEDRPVRRPACLVLGGETTVTIRGDGKGGRNQELALAAALDLQGLDRVRLVALATDGVDGPTDSAGAAVDGTTVARAKAMGLDPLTHLEENDAYPLFKALGDHLMLGPTGTNVNDLTFLLAE